MILRPRNNNVLLRQVKGTKTASGLVLSDRSVDYDRWFVEAVGPKVEDLNVGDMVIPGPWEEAAQVPPYLGEGLVLCRETNVVAIAVEASKTCQDREGQQRGQL